MDDTKTGASEQPGRLAEVKPGKPKARKPKITPTETLKKRLRDGTITPRERFILKVRDIVSKENTGKTIMSDGEREKLNNWTPETPNEKEEYARYKDGWKTIGFAVLDAQTDYLFAIIQWYEIIKLKAKLESEHPVSDSDKADLKKRVDLFIKCYQRLLMFKKMFTRLGAIYQVNLNTKIEKWLNELSALALTCDNLQAIAWLAALEGILDQEDIEEKYEVMEIDKAYRQEFGEIFKDELGPEWHYGI